MSTHSTSPGPHVLPLKIYLAVGIALMFLTVVTVLVSEIPLGGWNLVAALAIASVKVLLVVFFFMHLYYDHKLYFLLFSVAVIVLVVFITFTMFDTLERGAVYEIKGERINPKAVIYDRQNFKGPSTPGATDTSGMATKRASPESTAVKADSAARPAATGH
jgi:cytochrome c oxidase subunit IV